MRYLGRLATDYERHIAHDGHVDIRPTTRRAAGDVAASPAGSLAGSSTGREVDDLFPGQNSEHW